ncbi:MAG: hypothetical protein AABX93_03800 [Nanoarchaeota archaeon]
MVKEDIIRGLEGAMSRGESLEKAMYSFYNAGYKKEDVEEAARTLSLHLSQQESLIPRSINFFSRAMPKISVQKPLVNKSAESASEIKKMQMPMQIKINSSAIPKKTLTPIAKVNEVTDENPNIWKKPKSTPDASRYEVVQRTNPKTILIIILAVLLANLLTALAGVFIFREALLDFFNNFFSNIIP